MKRWGLLVVLFLFLAPHAHAQDLGQVSITGSSTVSLFDYYPAQPAGTFDVYYYQGAWPDTSATSTVNTCSGGGCDLSALGIISPSSFNPSTYFGVVYGDYWIRVQQAGQDRYYPLHFDGSSWTSYATGTPDVTRVTQVIPYSGQGFATGTPVTIGANGTIAIADQLDGFDVNKDELSVLFEYKTTRSSLATGALFALGGSSLFHREAIHIGTAGVSTYTFTLPSATTTPPLDAGQFTLITSIQKPNTVFGFSSVFGLFDFGHKTLYSTTTYFLMGSTTSPFESVLSGIRNNDVNPDGSQTGCYGTSTSATLQSCNLINVTAFSPDACVVALFVPCSRPDYGASFSAISSKPPFGYYTVVVAQLRQATSTGEASTTPTGITQVALWLAPLINGIAYILWFMLIIWIFNRIRKWDFQQ